MNGGRVSIRPSTLCAKSSEPFDADSVYEGQPPRTADRGEAASRQGQQIEGKQQAAGKGQQPALKDSRSRGSSMLQGRSSSQPSRTADRGAAPQAAVTIFLAVSLSP
jgi:hypothetical protein